MGDEMAKSKRTPRGGIDLNRLCEAMYSSRRDLERFRTERLNAVRQYVGGHWSADGSAQKVPVNLIALYTQIVGRSLIAKAPRLMLSTFDRAQKPAVAAMEAWANREVEKMGLAQTLQRVVIDALFSLGICKVGLMDPAQSSLWGWDVPAGTPFAERVDLDDFVFDTHARDFREASFIGHRFRVPLASVRDSTIYAKSRKNLQASDDDPYNVEGDERIGAMQRAETRTSEEFEEMVELWEVYLPRTKTLVVLPGDAVSGAFSGGDGADFDAAALREWEWVGPDSGPYHFLSLGVVPGNAMPKSPIQDLIDLHSVTNELYLKLMRQGERQKELLTVQGSADADGKRIMEADDGEIIRLDNPDKTKVASFGGPNQANLQLAMHFADKFSYMSGNLDAMGGLSPQAKTLGQDKMLAESASRAVTDMQGTAIHFVSEVGRALCWFWYHDPFRVMRVEHTVANVPETSIVREVYPRRRADQPPDNRLRRDGSWDELDLKVDPFSVQHSTPGQRLQSLMTVVQQVILPMQGLLQQAGVMFDVVKLLELMGKYMDLPDLSEIVTIQEPPQPVGSQGDPGGGGMPPNTSREYVRRSQGGTAGTASGRDAMLGNMTSPGDGPGMRSPE